MSDPLIFCALDTPDLDLARRWAAQIGAVTGGLKLGLEFFNAHGPRGVEEILHAAPKAKLFLDLKFHDIPNTVAGAVRSICANLAPAYMTVHTAGGTEMMAAAQQACGSKTKLLGVTVLTSMEQSDLQEIGITRKVDEQVKALASLALKSGLAGLVCAAHEIKDLRTEHGTSPVMMVPGIRPEGAAKSDQKRVMTPQQALSLGATHLVIGRPITQAKDPAAAAKNILDQIHDSR